MEKQDNQKVTWWHWHRRLYNWVIHFADTKHGPTALFVLSFAESSFFPIPPDVLLAPLTLGAPKKWFRFASACSIASVLGGIFGFGIGMFLWSAVGDTFHNYVPGFARDKVVMVSGQEYEGDVDLQSIKVNTLSTEPVYPLKFNTTEGESIVIQKEQVEDIEINPFTQVGALYTHHDWIIVAIAGFTPIPFKVITITAGVFEINFIVFVIASALSRSARFFLVAGMFGWKGESIRPFVEKYFNLLSLAFVILLIGGFLVLKVLH